MTFVRLNMLSCTYPAICAPWLTGVIVQAIVYPLVICPIHLLPLILQTLSSTRCSFSPSTHSALHPNSWMPCLRGELFAHPVDAYFAVTLHWYPLWSLHNLSLALEGRLGLQLHNRTLLVRPIVLTHPLHHSHASTLLSHHSTHSLTLHAK